MENRHGLAVRAQTTQAVGPTEPETALDLATAIPGEHQVTLGGDKGSDAGPFVAGCRQLHITPHVAQSLSGRASAIDRRTTRHPGYAVSQWCRKQVEEIFGWLKTVGLLRKLRHRGTPRVNWMFVFTTTVYNLVQMRNLAAEAA